MVIAIAIEESKYEVTADRLLTVREGVTRPTFEILGSPFYLGNGRK